MNKLFYVTLFIAPALYASEYCDGFEQGYKAIKGDWAIVPFCPIEPITPINSTPFQEGIKDGIERATDSF